MFKQRGAKISPAFRLSFAGTLQIGYERRGLNIGPPFKGALIVF